MSKAPVFLLVVLSVTCLQPLCHAQAGGGSQESGVILVDASGPAHPFPHYWEKMFGSGRAILSLRESYRRDLRAVKQATGFDFIRFHAIFHDEVGLYDEDPDGKPIY